MILKEIALTCINFEKQVDFYQNTLGFKLNINENNSFELQTQQSKLVFIKDDIQKQNYHYAFLVCEKHFREALNYIKERNIPILPITSETNDRVNKEEVKVWNSGQSFYFYDADENILEFIFRPTLEHSSDKPFSLEEIISINEIGIPVKDPMQLAYTLMNDHSIVVPQNFINGFHETFCWFGGFDGTLLLVQHKRHWYPTALPAKLAKLEVVIEQDKQLYLIRFEEGKMITLMIDGQIKIPAK